MPAIGICGQLRYRVTSTPTENIVAAKIIIRTPPGGLNRFRDIMRPPAKAPTAPATVASAKGAQRSNRNKSVGV